MKIEEVLLKEYETGNVGKPGHVTKPGDAAPAPSVAAPAVNNDTSSYGVPTPGSGGHTKWPASKAEVEAFQRSQGIKPVDGLIGKNTMAALQKSGATPPPGFKPVGNKAKPATPKAGATTPAAPAADQATAAQTQTSNYAGGDQRTANARDATAAPPAAAPAAEPAAVAANPGTPAAGVGFNQGAPNPEIARLQQLGGMQAQVANPLQPAPGDAAQAAAAPAPGDAAQAAAAPSALPNPWDGKDPTKAAAWSALSPEDQKWLGNADPTDKFILARSPSKGGLVGSITPNFMKKKQPAAGQGGQPVATPGSPQAGSAFNQGAAKESADLTAMLRIAGLR